MKEWWREVFKGYSLKDFFWDAAGTVLFLALAAGFAIII